MTTSQSQDPDTRAQEQAEWRALKIFRAAAALVVLTVIAVGGIVALATGHNRSGLAALVVGGVGVVGVSITIAGRILRRRRASG
jgi:hypothetical protein